MRALIVGGGIGGLSAAIALRDAGLDVEVFENAPELREVGAAITLWSNALRAGRTLGVDAEIIKAGGEMRHGRSLTWRGKLLFEFPFGEIAREVGAPCICLTRAALQRILADRVGPALRLNARCTGIAQDADGVTATFADGSSARGDLLVGADGIHSIVRDLLFGREALRYAGHRAWRAMAPIRHPEMHPGVAVEYWGPGANFGIVPFDHERAYWFGTRRAPEGTRDERPKAKLLELYEGWPSPIRALIEATPESGILQGDIHDRPPSREWGRGRVTLLGDAIHPMTPNLGQGGCLAMEDAVDLAASLKMTRDIEAALRAYEKRRHPRCAWIVRESRSMGRMSVMANPVLTTLRDLGIKLAPNWWLQGRYRKLVNYPS